MPATATAPAAETAPQAQRSRRILVTGVGGAPGVDLAQALQRRSCQVIGLDAHPMAIGLQLPGLIPRVVLPASDPGFLSDLVRLCRDLRPDALISTVEAELPHLTAAAEELSELGVRTWLPGTRALKACLDKAVFHTVLTEAGIPTPRTWLPHEIDQVPASSPLVVKPRAGQGSRDVVFCHTRAQAEVLCELVPHPIVQERLRGTEFTADCLVDRTASVILRYRQVVKGGLSMVSTTFHDPYVAERVRETLAAVGVTGACCVQGFLGSGDQPVMITEMNARLAGAFQAAELAGADLTGQLLAGLWGQPIDHGRLRYQDGIRTTKVVSTLTATPIGAPAATFAAAASHWRKP